MDNQRILLIRDAQSYILTNTLEKLLKPTLIFDVHIGEDGYLDALCQHLMKTEYDIVMTPTTRDHDGYGVIDTIRAQHLGDVVGYGVDPSKKVGHEPYDIFLNCTTMLETPLKERVDKALGFQ